MPIPVIDSRVKYVGASALRGLNVKALRELSEVWVVQVDERPAAVVVPYDLYLKMQEAIWPSSLLPALEKFLSQEPVSDDGGIGRTESGHLYRRGEQHKCGVADCPANTAETKIYEDDKATVVDRSGQTPNPSMADWGVDGFGSKSHGDLPTPPSPEVNAIGTDMTPRGAKFARVDDSKPPVFDDADYPDPPPLSQVILDSTPTVIVGSSDEANGTSLTEDLIRKEIDDLSHKKEPVITTVADEGAGPRCHHCEKLNASILCSDCFLEGHRNGTCLKCAEGAQAK